MIYFYNHDYKKALEQLEYTLREFKDYKYQSPMMNDYEQALMIKLMVMKLHITKSKTFIGKSLRIELIPQQV